MRYTDKYPYLQQVEKQIQESKVDPFASFFYRGQANTNWQTKSTLARNNSQKTNEELIEIEKENVRKYVESCETEIYHHLGNENLKQWYYIAQAQHLGVHTRLLDWTLGWERALFFLLDDGGENDAYDGVLLHTDTRLNLYGDEDLAGVDPYQNDKFMMVSLPIHHTDQFGEQLGMGRISKQIGKFLVVPQETIQESLEDVYAEYIGKIVIKASDKKALRQELESLGICKKTIYYPHY